MVRCAVLWCIFFASAAQAVPQFGRLKIHALDETSSQVMAGIADMINNRESTSMPVSTSVSGSGSSTVLATSATPELTSTTTSGTSSHSQSLEGVHTALFLSAAASVVYLVF